MDYGTSFRMRKDSGSTPDKSTIAPSSLDCEFMSTKQEVIGSIPMLGTNARVAQRQQHHFDKVTIRGSSPLSRTIFYLGVSQR